MALKMPAPKAAEIAIGIGSIGCGYDIGTDLRLKYCKGNNSKDSCLFEIDEDGGHEIVFPDAANTKTLVYDGVFITLYTVSLEKSQMVLRDNVRKAVPSTLEPEALTRFIETYGTHIIVGEKMGGKDVICIKQQHSSTLQTADIQKRLKDVADKRFLDVSEHYSMVSEQGFSNDKFEIREQRLRFANKSPSSSYAHKEINHQLESSASFLEFQLPKQRAPVFTPIESDEDLSIVTGAQLQVENHGFKNILFLRLLFATVSGAIFVKQPEWEGSHGSVAKSGLISTLISHHFTQVQKPPPSPADVNINSAVYPGGPPVPIQATKLLKYVDTTEITRGPQEIPGYWVVSGARLIVKKGEISLLVKSLLTALLPDEDGIDEQ
ncbi:MACPF domain-containing protein [Hibiscus syriacus]|uniref:MACPF domain-containing protein n=1 Tax=Hibiscus syriacus TaxID=106335 RepID=A0A6A3A452_HIBSY|nr:MACPF domain-containing protein [Hibiscus syriacus]